MVPLESFSTEMACRSLQRKNASKFPLHRFSAPYVSFCFYQEAKIEGYMIIIITLVMRSFASFDIEIPCFAESGHLIGPDSIFMNI
jgi:hypothetical protein